MPLHIAIVGAGIGGLSAAIALSREGHNIEIFEKSRFSHEAGAAIHVAPNASRLLTAWGCDLANLQPVYCHSLNVHSKDEKKLLLAKVAEDLKSELAVKAPWLLVHRVDLHNAIRELAEKKSANGSVQIHLSSGVTSVKAEEGEITFNDGTKGSFDLIVGADGVHSKTVASILEHKPEMFDTNQNCYRFLVPTKKALAVPAAKALLDKIGMSSVDAFVAEDRRLIIYPCRNGELLNVGGIYEPRMQDGRGDCDWLAEADKAHLVDTFKDFGPGCQALCHLAEDVKLWSLSTRDPPKAFSKGRLVLIGDAAHPTLPHQGQGGAQAIEDAAALGSLFVNETKPSEVQSRATLYNKTRYNHAVTVMFMSRTSDDNRDVMLKPLREFVPDAEYPTDMIEYLWHSFPDHEAASLLRKEMLKIRSLKH